MISTTTTTTKGGGALISITIDTKERGRKENARAKEKAEFHKSAILVTGKHERVEMPKARLKLKYRERLEI